MSDGVQPCCDCLYRIDNSLTIVLVLAFERLTWLGGECQVKLSHSGYGQTSRKLRPAW